MDPDPTPEELEKLRKENEEKELAEEVEKVKKEYAEKQKKKKEKEKEKDKKEEGEKEKEKDKDKDKEEDKPPKAEEKTLEAKKTDEEPRVFRLHKCGLRYFPPLCITNPADRTIFENRLRRIRQQQMTKINQDRVRSPIAFPSVPKNDLL